jgi:hypothetical protein
MMQTVADRLAVALAGAVDEASRNICLHEETHRSGAIWNVCDQCGTCWPDDGFKPIASQPEWYAPAVQALAAYKVEKEEQRDRA